MMEYGRRYDMSDIDRTVMDFFVLNKYADLQKDDDWDELLSELRQLFPGTLFEKLEIQQRWATIDEVLAYEYKVKLPPKEKCGWRTDLDEQAKLKSFGLRLSELKRNLDVQTKQSNQENVDSESCESDFDEGPVQFAAQEPKSHLSYSICPQRKRRQCKITSFLKKPSDKASPKDSNILQESSKTPRKHSLLFEPLSMDQPNIKLPVQIFEGQSFHIICRETDVMDYAWRRFLEYIIKAHGGIVVQDHKQVDFVIASLHKEETNAFQKKTGCQKIHDATLILSHGLKEASIKHSDEYLYYQEKQPSNEFPNELPVVETTDVSTQTERECVDGQNNYSEETAAAGLEPIKSKNSLNGFDLIANTTQTVLCTHEVQDEIFLLYHSTLSEDQQKQLMYTIQDCSKCRSGKVNESHLELKQSEPEDCEETLSFGENPVQISKCRTKRNSIQFDRGHAILFKLAPEYLNKKRSFLLKQVMKIYNIKHKPDNLPIETLKTWTKRLDQDKLKNVFKRLKKRYHLKSCMLSSVLKIFLKEKPTSKNLKKWHRDKFYIVRSPSKRIGSQQVWIFNY